MSVIGPPTFFKTFGDILFLYKSDSIQADQTGMGGHYSYDITVWFWYSLNKNIA